MIKIEEDPFAEILYYSGTYTKDDEEYIFTLIDNDDSPCHLEVTWCDETPDNHKLIESDIIKIYQSR